MVVETPRGNLVDGMKWLLSTYAARLNRRHNLCGDLSQGRTGDPGKIKTTVRLRREATMTLSWVAQRLCLATRTDLSHLFCWCGREKQPGKSKGSLEPFNDTENRALSRGV